MNFLITVLALAFSQQAFAQTQPTILEPLKPLDQSVSPQQTPNPGQNPGQNPPNPGQNPGQNPQPCKGKGCKGGSEYDSGSAEYDQVYYTPAYISRMIANDMKIQCYRGLCEMAMVDTRGQAFVVEVSAGYGNQMMNGMGSGNGGVVVVGGTGSYNYNSQPYFGVTLRYVTQRCKQSIRVPTSLYVSMNTYLYNLINEDGTTKRTFDPAEQTMILFYTTVMKQATGCTTPTR